MNTVTPQDIRTAIGTLTDDLVAGLTVRQVLAEGWTNTCLQGVFL